MTIAIHQAALSRAHAPAINQARPDSKGQETAEMRQLAEEFEAGFLAEMLKHSGLGKMPEMFNGGVGEEAFSDFLTREYATKIAQNGSVGIADQVFATLVERSRGS